MPPKERKIKPPDDPTQWVGGKPKIDMNTNKLQINEFVKRHKKILGLPKPPKGKRKSLTQLQEELSSGGHFIGTKGAAAAKNVSKRGPMVGAKLEQKKKEEEYAKQIKALPQGFSEKHHPKKLGAMASIGATAVTDPITKGMVLLGFSSDYDFLDPPSTEEVEMSGYGGLPVSYMIGGKPEPALQGMMERQWKAAHAAGKKVREEKLAKEAAEKGEKDIKEDKDKDFEKRYKDWRGYEYGSHTENENFDYDTMPEELELEILERHAAGEKVGSNIIKALLEKYDKPWRGAWREGELEKRLDEVLKMRAGEISDDSDDEGGGFLSLGEDPDGDGPEYTEMTFEGRPYLEHWEDGAIHNLQREYVGDWDEDMNDIIFIHQKFRDIHEKTTPTNPGNEVVKAQVAVASSEEEEEEFPENAGWGEPASPSSYQPVTGREGQWSSFPPKKKDEKALQEKLSKNFGWAADSDEEDQTNLEDTDEEDTDEEDTDEEIDHDLNDLVPMDFETINYLENEETGQVYNLQREYVGDWNEDVDDIIFIHQKFRDAHETARP